MSADTDFISKAIDAGAAAGQKFGFEKAKLQVVMLMIDEMNATQDAAQTLAFAQLIGKVQQLRDVPA